MSLLGLTETGADLASIGSSIESFGRDLGSGGVSDPYSAAFKFGATALDIGAGGPQKRLREARALRDAALAEAEAERLRAASGGAAPSGGGFLGFLSQPSPILGQPWGVVIAVGGVALWLAAR